jgi:hypothetical protein
MNYFNDGNNGSRRRDDTSDDDLCNRIDLVAGTRCAPGCKHSRRRPPPSPSVIQDVEYIRRRPPPPPPPSPSVIRDVEYSRAKLLNKQRNLPPLTCVPGCICRSRRGGPSFIEMGDDCRRDRLDDCRVSKQLRIYDPFIGDIIVVKERNQIYNHKVVDIARQAFSIGKLLMSVDNIYERFTAAKTILDASPYVSIYLDEIREVLPAIHKVISLIPTVIELLISEEEYIPDNLLTLELDEINVDLIRELSDDIFTTFSIFVRRVKDECITIEDILTAVETMESIATHIQDIESLYNSTTFKKAHTCTILRFKNSEVVSRILNRVC